MRNRVRSLVVVGALAGMSLGPCLEAQAALNAYLRVKGQKQGEIRGSAMVKGVPGAMAVLEADPGVPSGRDAESGLPTGKEEQPGPFVITKALDAATPKLYQALLAGELLPEVVLTVYAPEDRAAVTPLSTVKLENAAISRIRLVPGQDGKTAATEISFTYQRIERSGAGGESSAMDDWEAPGGQK